VHIENPAYRSGIQCIRHIIYRESGIYSVSGIQRVQQICHQFVDERIDRQSLLTLHTIYDHQRRLLVFAIKLCASSIAKTSAFLALRRGVRFSNSAKPCDCETGLLFKESLLDGMFGTGDEVELGNNVVDVEASSGLINTFDVLDAGGNTSQGNMSFKSFPCGTPSNAGSNAGSRSMGRSH
jgi:hypothetical protein